MKTTRRAFLKTSLAAGFGATGVGHVSAAELRGPDKTMLDRILDAPIF